jgi:hypothetical protein
VQFNFSKKVLLLTTDKRFEAQVRQDISSFDLEVEQGSYTIASLQTIKRVLRTVKSTSFIRSELFSYIKENGFPYMVIMDFRIDLDMGSDFDPGNLKVLKSLLISYIVFSMGRGFEKLHLNLLLVFEHKDREVCLKLDSSPQQLLSLLQTQNEQVNQLINKLKVDPLLYNKIFLMHTLLKDEVSGKLAQKIGGIKMTFDSKQKMVDKVLKSKLSSVSKEKVEPADVIFKSGGVYYYNGEAIESVVEKYESIEEGKLYVDGHWTSHTLMDVRNRIRKTVSKAIKEHRFQPNQELHLCLLEKCIIDASIASTLASLLIQDFAKMQKVKVLVSSHNEPILKESEGYNMVKEYLIYE